MFYIDFTVFIIFIGEEVKMSERKTVSNEKPTLKKELGLFEATAIVIGMVIGSGIFFKPSIVFKNAGGPGLGILAWIVGGVITLASGLTVAEIAAAVPETGGLFAYLRKLYGEKWAFLLGWVQTLVYVPGSTAAQAIVFATSATFFIPMTAVQQKVLAIFMIILIMTVNIISTKFGGKVQNAATVAKLLPIIVIIFAGLAMGKVHNFTPMSGPVSSTAGFGAAVLGTLWAYDGWISVGNVAGEIKDPAKDLPRSIIFGLVLCIVVYVLVNLALLNVLPMKSIIASGKPASDAAVILFGKGGAAIISAGIMISIFGALNGYLMTGARVPFAMSQDNLLPFSSFLGKVTKGSKTPVNSLIFETILASLYVLTGSFNLLTDLVVFVLWIFFTMAVAGIFILRTKYKDLKRPYKVPLYPVVPIIGIIGGLFIIINTLKTDTANALYGVIITLIGIPVYMYMMKKKNLSK